jgi:hypothetical protein
MNLATFLLAITGSLAARVVTSLGIGIFSYAAITTLVNTVIAQVTTNYNSMSSVVLQIVNLAGFGSALGILFSAMVVRASLTAIKKMRPV